MKRTLTIVMMSSLFACGSTSHTELPVLPAVDSGPPKTVLKPDADLPEVPEDLFSDAGDFVPKTPSSSSSLVSRHIFHTGKSLTGTDCTPCHDGNTDDAPALAFGGTVYYSPDAKEVAPGVEIRVVDAEEGVHVVYSDQAGNFWLIGNPTTFNWVAHTGARTATDSQLMTATFDKPGCNQGMCHDGSDDYPFISVRKAIDPP